MRAILRAGFDGWLAVRGVGPDGGKEDGGFAGEVAELDFVEVADLDGWRWLADVYSEVECFSHFADFGHQLAQTVSKERCDSIESLM